MFRACRAVYSRVLNTEMVYGKQKIANKNLQSETVIQD